MKLDITIQEAETLYLELSSKDFSLDLTRGRPHRDQLSLSDGLEKSLSGDYFYEEIEINLFSNLLRSKLLLSVSFEGKYTISKYEGTRIRHT